MTRKLSLGIDLGTSNSCLSLCAVDGGPAQTVPVTQVLAPAVIGEKPLLPSVLYLPAPGEYADGSFVLPWNDADARGSIVGSFARERGATVPDRVVSSAKSWLCNPDVDRRAPILPWQSDLGDAKLSPFEATRRYLAHLRHAAEAHLAGRDDGATLADCQIVLTVPASFDEVARTLTHEAALAVGLSEVTLLEEPQAAFYAWINQSAHAPGATPWTDEVAPGDLVLVCDIGGGTADFSLIAVASAPAGLSKNLELHRVAVGEHILLGGDNMDLALAYHLRGKLEEAGHELDAWQFQALVHATREAKERLLGNDTLAETQVAVPSRGSEPVRQDRGDDARARRGGGDPDRRLFPRHRRHRLAGTAQVGRAAGVRARLCDRARRQPPPRAVPAARARERALRRRPRGPGRHCGGAPRRWICCDPRRCCSTAACSRRRAFAPASSSCCAPGSVLTTR